MTHSPTASEEQTPFCRLADVLAQLIEAIARDDNNGGLTSRETIRMADEARLTLWRAQREDQP